MMASVFPTPKHTTFGSNLSISELGRFTKERSQFEDSPYYRVSIPPRTQNIQKEMYL